MSLPKIKSIYVREIGDISASGKYPIEYKNFMGEPSYVQLCNNGSTFIVSARWVIAVEYF